MASPTPTGTSARDAPNPAVRGNILALWSVLLAIAAPVAALLAFYLAFGIPWPVALYPVVIWLTVALYLVGFIACAAAIVTGVLALLRARRHSPQQRYFGSAIMGIVVGVLAAIPLVYPGGIVVLVLLSCVTGSGCV
jgi:hypothetical protein